MRRRSASSGLRVGRRRPNTSVVVGLGLLGLLLLLGYVAPLALDPLATDAAAALQPPSATHWFGTDRVGADVFSRTVRAARLDLTLALLGTAAALALGVPLGLIASTKGPWGERIMRGLDTFQAFPLVVLALAVVSLSGNRIEMIPFAIALINIPRYMRLIRSEVLSLREKRFVVAAFASGARTARILRRHILPNLRGIILAQTSLAAAHALVVIAALSFLGVGLQPPTPSWGAMIRSGSQHVTSGEWWVFTFPGLAIVIAVISFNRIADGLLDMDADR
jgi:peptide/nickel transport system permease protein